MSFNQYRTNPGQAVSNFKGRTDTPKAWPSTAVSTWMNGGLFGGGVSTGPGLEYISTLTVASTSSTLLSITSIPQNYRDLYIRFEGCKAANYGVVMYWRVNNVADASVYSQYMGFSRLTSSGIALATFEDRNETFGGHITGPREVNGGSNKTFQGTFMLPDYAVATTKNPQVQGFMNTSTSDTTGAWSYVNTSLTPSSLSGTSVVRDPITSIQLEMATNSSSDYNWVAGSKIHLYGIGTKRVVE